VRPLRILLGEKLHCAMDVFLFTLFCTCEQRGQQDHTHQSQSYTILIATYHSDVPTFNRISSTQTSSGKKSSFWPTKTVSSVARTKLSTALEAGSRSLPSTGSWAITPTPSFVPSNTVVDASSSSGILGVIQNGTVLGPMDPRSGLPSGYRHCPLWGIRLGMMVSF
jgi:hypothetical protein